MPTPTVPTIKFLDGSGLNAQGQNVQAPVPTNSQTANLNIPKTVPTQSLTANVTNFDLSKVLAQNQQIRNDFITKLNDTKTLNAARQRSTDAYNTLQNFDVSLEGGIQNIMKKPVALEFQQGQASALTRDAAFTRSSLARSYEATGLDLQNVTQARADLLKQYEYLMQFGQEDVNTGFKLDEIKRSDEKLKYDQMQAAKDFALKQKVEKPYYEVGGTIYRASDGKAYSTPEEFWADGGSKNFSDVQGNLQTPEDRQEVFQQKQFARSIFESDRAAGMQQQQLDAAKNQPYADALGNLYSFNSKTGKFEKQVGADIGNNSGMMGLPKVLYDKGAAIADDFRQEPIVKNYNEVLNKAQSVEAIINQGVGGPGDLAIVYEFMRALDPTSVVRESEYATAAKSGNLFLGALTKFNGYFKEQGGFLPDNVKQGFMDILQSKLEIASSQYQNVYNEYGRRIDGATGQKGMGSQFLTDYSAVLNQDSALQDLANEITGSRPPSSGGVQPVDINKAIRSGGLSFNSAGNASASNQVKGITQTAPKLQYASNPALLSIATKRFAPGSVGGQCGVFVRNIANSFGLDYPRLGNSLTEKINAVKNHGTSLANAGIGSVIVTKENSTYGHVAWIVGKNEQGYQVVESNFKQSERISYGRTIPYNSPKIVGVINPSLA